MEKERNGSIKVILTQSLAIEVALVERLDSVIDWRMTTRVGVGIVERSVTVFVLEVDIRSLWDREAT